VHDANELGSQSMVLKDHKICILMVFMVQKTVHGIGKEIIFTGIKSTPSCPANTPFPLPNAYCLMPVFPLAI